MNTFTSSKAYHSRIPGESVINNDADSDRAILEEEEGKGLGIMKTTEVTVSKETEASSSKEVEFLHKQSHDWQEQDRSTSGTHAI
jgi:hypothetical protein